MNDMSGVNRNLPRTADVVVVGAGLAGLTAADELVRAGHNVVLLEGRDRVGGRIRTVEVAGTLVDAGATWVAPHHTAIRALVDRLGCQFTPQYHAGERVSSFDGERKAERSETLDPGALADMTRTSDALQALADSLPLSSPWEHPDAERLDSLSFGEWLASMGSMDSTRKFFEILCLVHWGAPVGDVSLFNVIRYISTLGGLETMRKIEGGDQQDRILGTAQGLAEKFAGTLGPRVIVDAPVRRISQDGKAVTVETAQGTITAQFAIVTASPTHRSMIEFAPELPEQHYGLARSWRLGALSKAFVAYDRPFWREAGLSGEAVSDDKTVFLTFDVSPGEQGPGILMVFCDARGFDDASKDDRRQRVLRHLVHLYGDQANEVADYTDFAWGSDTFAAGGPNPQVGPNAWTSFGRFLREPVGRVHWAGTETADETSGTMNGAILSGERAAREVMAQLEASGAVDAKPKG